jgi:hypothetical protein
MQVSDKKMEDTPYHKRLSKLTAPVRATTPLVFKVIFFVLLFLRIFYTSFYK